MGDDTPDDASTDAETEPEEAPRYPWVSCDATAKVRLQVKWGWVSDGEWAEVVGEASVGHRNAGNQLSVAIEWWRSRWQEIIERERQRQAQATGGESSA